LGRIFFANDRPAQRLTLAVNQLMDDPGAPLFKTTTIGALPIKTVFSFIYDIQEK
jgi:hypothetical protein